MKNWCWKKFIFKDIFFPRGLVYHWEQFLGAIPIQCLQTIFVKLLAVMIVQQSFLYDCMFLNGKVEYCLAKGVRLSWFDLNVFWFLYASDLGPIYFVWTSIHISISHLISGNALLVIQYWFIDLIFETLNSFYKKNARAATPPRIWTPKQTSLCPVRKTLC